ncbi:hypothetical protein [Alloactinosynnema sp. L-07]|uniref:hypothetical protein n=1 Tax=Alloactinosynnema sp. L-07 TaxID=1653480 RepID=UPI00065F08C3|nr:hypothetical protein [Alloactinosynnema sp. L-07]CRK59401.1 hypothetical protein [Alloactinosynnema sp. L-07]
MADEPGGLAFGPPEDGPSLETLRHDARKLTDITPVDITGHTAFAPTEKKVDIAAAARLRPEVTGLRVGADLDRLDAGLDTLNELAANARIERLLKQARVKVDEQKFHMAITLIDQALAIDANFPPALALLAICRCSLSEYEPGLDALARATANATDPEMNLRISDLRAECEQIVIDGVTTRLDELMAADEPAAALRLVESVLRGLPTDPVLRYCHAGVLLTLGRAADARDVVTAALASATGPAEEAFGELLDQILGELHGPQIDQARRCLRDRDPKGAIRQLELCHPKMRGHGDGRLLWAYANERYAARAMLGFVGRKRMLKAETQPLPQVSLQSVLLWLLHEELIGGRTAIDDGDYAEAAALLTAANHIDPRCSAVAYLRTVALILLSRKLFSTGDATVLPTVERHLVDAEESRAVAMRDPEYATEAAEFTDVIAEDLTQVQLIISVVAVIDSFDSAIEDLKRRPPRDHYQVNRYRDRFLTIQLQAGKVRRMCPEDSSEADAMSQIISAVGRIVA